jgi:hypothetical protein
LPIIDDTLFNGQIYGRLINPINTTNSTGTVKVYWSLDISGDETFQVASPNLLMDSATYGDGTDGSTPSDILHAQMSVGGDLRAEFRQPFKPLVPSKTRMISEITMGEEVGSFTELLKRFTMYSEGDTSTTLNVAPFDFSNGSMEIWNIIMRTFLFKRGSVRLKFLVATASRMDFWVYVRELKITDTDAYLNACVWNYIANKPVTEVQVPFYTLHHFYCKTFQGINGACDDMPRVQLNVQPMVTLTGLTHNVYIGVGDDFTVGWPTGPIIRRQIVPAKKKSPQVATDLGTFSAIPRAKASDQTDVSKPATSFYKATNSFLKK